MVLGQSHTAPPKVLRLAERAQFVLDHPGWTFTDYDNAKASDIAFMRDFETMRSAAERQAVAEAKRKADEEQDRAHGKQHR